MEQEKLNEIMMKLDTIQFVLGVVFIYYAYLMAKHTWGYIKLLINEPIKIQIEEKDLTEFQLSKKITDELLDKKIAQMRKRKPTPKGRNLIDKL